MTVVIMIVTLILRLLQQEPTIYDSSVRFFKAPEGGSDDSSDSSDEVRVVLQIRITLPW
jgi:hypothetical protein